MRYCSHWNRFQKYSYSIFMPILHKFIFLLLLHFRHHLCINLSRCPISANLLILSRELNNTINDIDHVSIALTPLSGAVHNLNRKHITSVDPTDYISPLMSTSTCWDIVCILYLHKNTMRHPIKSSVEITYDEFLSCLRAKVIDSVEHTFVKDLSKL